MTPNILSIRPVRTIFFTGPFALAASGRLGRVCPEAVRICFSRKLWELRELWQIIGNDEPRGFAHNMDMHLRADTGAANMADNSRATKGGQMTRYRQIESDPLYAEPPIG